MNGSENGVLRTYVRASRPVYCVSHPLSLPWRLTTMCHLELLRIFSVCSSLFTHQPFFMIYPSVLFVHNVSSYPHIPWIYFACIYKYSRQLMLIAVYFGRDNLFPLKRHIFLSPPVVNKRLSLSWQHKEDQVFTILHRQLFPPSDNKYLTPEKNVMASF